MSEKYYVLTTHTKEQYDAISAELAASDSTPETIPDRSVDCTDIKEHSDVRGEFSLTEDEATALQSDNRVKVINAVSYTHLTLPTICSV